MDASGGPTTEIKVGLGSRWASTTEIEVGFGWVVVSPTEFGVPVNLDGVGLGLRGVGDVTRATGRAACVLSATARWLPRGRR